MSPDLPFAPPVWPFLHPPEPPAKIPAMTVGIGVICEGGKAVVLAADRMITCDDPAVEYESSATKLVPIAKHTAVAVTGGLPDAQYVLGRLDPATNLGSVAGIAEAILRSRADLRRTIVETQFTKRYLGVDLKEFGDHETKNINPLYNDVANRISQYILKLGFLVAGVDQGGAGLYLVNEASSVAVTMASTGFAAIGSGHALAYVTFGRDGYRKTQPLAEAVYRVYEAKRAAQLAPGVGPETDIAIVSATKPVKFLSDRAINELGLLYDELRKPLRVQKKHRRRIEKLLP